MSRDLCGLSKVNAFTLLNQGILLDIEQNERVHFAFPALELSFTTIRITRMTCHSLTPVDVTADRDTPWGTGFSLNMLGPTGWSKQ